MKGKNIVRSIVDLCLSIIALVGVVFALLASKQFYDVIKYFTLVSNCLAAAVFIFDFILLISKKDPIASKPFRFLITVALVCVFVVNLILLEPVRKTPISFYEIFLHYVVPVGALVTYYVFDIIKGLKFRYSFTPLILLAVYGSYAIPLVSTGVWNDFYGFLHLGNQSKLLENLLILVIIVLSTYLVSLIIWLSNRLICAKLTPIETTPVSEEIPNEEPISDTSDSPVVEFEQVELDNEEEQMAKEVKKPAPKKAPAPKKVEEKQPAKKAAPLKKETPEKKVEVKPAAKKEAPKKIEPKKEVKIETVNDDEEADDTPVSYRIYHISKRKDDGKWQVKFAKGQKAIKLFRTQAEAIEYAKVLAENQGGSIRIHSLKGKIRK